MMNKRGDNLTIDDLPEPKPPTINYFYQTEKKNSTLTSDALAEEWTFENGEKKYRVMGNATNLYNPYNIYGESHNKMINDIRRWKMIDVPHDVFQAYLTFLHTRNEARLRVAERQMR